MLDLDRHRAVSGPDDPVRVGGGEDRQVRASPGRLYEGGGGTASGAFPLGDLVDPKPLLGRAVEVVVGAMARLEAGGDPALQEGRHRPGIADRQRPADSMERAGAALVVL